MCHSISDGSSEGLPTVGGPRAEPRATTPTSEQAKYIDQKSRNRNEESYEAEDGIPGESHLFGRTTAAMLDSHEKLVSFAIDNVWANVLTVLCAMNLSECRIQQEKTRLNNKDHVT